MRRLTLIALLWMVALAGWSTDSQAAINKVILRVNDRIVTLYDYEKKVAERLAALRHAEVPPARKRQMLDTAPEDTLREIFDETLLLSRADQLGIFASPVEIDGMVANTRQQAGITSDEQFKAALAESGMTEEQMRTNMANTFLVRAVISREVQPRVVLDQERFRRYYRQNPDEFRVDAEHRLQELVVLDSVGLSGEEMQQVATEIVSRLQAGDEMADIADEYVTQGKTTGVIDLGWVQRDDLDDALAAAVEELKAGGVSEPVAGRGGLHIAQVLGHHEARIRDFEEVEQQIANHLQKTEFDDELLKYIQELKARSFVELDLPQEAAGFQLDRPIQPDRALVPGMDLESPHPAASDEDTPPESSADDSVTADAPTPPAE